MVVLIVFLMLLMVDFGGRNPATDRGYANGGLMVDFGGRNPATDRGYANGGLMVDFGGSNPATDRGYANGVDSSTVQIYPLDYLSVVRQFADNVLEHGRDRYGEVHSPLFVDGMNTRTHEPVRWEHEGESWILSNFASQQNLIRVLDALTNLTDVPKYRDAAVEATQYMYRHHADQQGLLHWGGHQFVDLQTMQHQFEGRPHELKNNFPYYEFMWEVDSTATRRMLQAMWNAHIMDWSVLDMNRHAEFNTPAGPLWGHEFHQAEPFFEGRGLTFINFGTDMMHVALSLYFLGEEEGARVWGTRLFEQYVRARHPETGLGVYQYSQPVRRETPPAEGPLTGRLTFSSYGDRAQNQFGAVYGDIALEGNALWESRIATIYGRSAIITLHLASQLEGRPEGSYLLDKTVAGMEAIARYSYDTGRNVFRPLWADGTDLTGHTIQRTGYFGREGESFPELIPDGIMALAFTRAALMSGSEELWRVLRSMLVGAGLGDPGSEIGAAPELRFDTTITDPDYLFAVLELYRATGQAAYLQLARHIGNAIVENRFHEGYFKPGLEYIFARFDNAESLALLTLAAIEAGRPDAVPPYLGSVGSTQGDHDGLGNIRDFLFFEETD
jgi:pectate lyase